MGYQEFLVTKNNHSIEEFVKVFKEDVTGITIPKKRIEDIDHPTSEIETGTELVVLFGDRHDIRCLLREMFSDEIYWYSEQVNLALLGTYFPKRDQLAQFFDFRKIGEIVVETKTNVYECTGKHYTLEEVRDYWRDHSFVTYNDRDFYSWLKSQTVFKEIVS